VQAPLARVGRACTPRLLALLIKAANHVLFPARPTQLDPL